MSDSRIASNISAPANSTAITKKARLIPKDLDRSNLRRSAHSNRKQKALKAGVSRPGSKKFRGKVRGKFQKSFKLRGPSNYEANSRVTHNLVPSIPTERLMLQHSAKCLSSTHSNQLPVPTGVLEIEHSTTVVQRALTYHYQPSSPANSRFSRELRNRRLQLDSNYRQLRFALTGAPRLRASYRATLQKFCTRYWTSKKRSATLYVPDARKLGRRTRRRSGPRVSLTVVRAQLARQLIRKFRASRGPKHTAVRRRLLRFRWFNRKFLKRLKYPRRRRMLRRAIRRASRYLQTTISILSGAAQRHALSRNRSRARRLVAKRSETAIAQLLRTSVEGLTQRQQLLNQQQRTRKLQAIRLLEVKSRFLNSLYRVKSSLTSAQSRRAAGRLERKLLARPTNAANTVRPAYRSSELLQRQTVGRASRWLALKNTRVQKKALFVTKYLATPFATLQRLRTSRRIRRLTRQSQQPQATSEIESSQLYPAAASTLYSATLRRFQLKTLVADELAHTLPAPATTGVNQLSAVTAFSCAGKTMLWRRPGVPTPATRLQLPSFARNSALRGRTSALSVRAPTVSATDNVLTTQRAANLILRTQRRRVAEKHFYAHRIPLRLPRTVVKRAEIRRSGVRLFARNTLKNPETWAGKRKLFLPVSKSYSLTSKNAVRGFSPSQLELRPVRRMLSEHPRVWARGPGYRESAMIYDIRDKKRSASVRANLRVAKLRSRKAARPVATKISASASRADNLASTLSATGDDSEMTPAAVAKLSLLRVRALRAVRYSARRSAGRVSPVLSGVAVGRTALRPIKESSQTKKQKALWHLRSVQKMLTSERSLSAWSPQYPTRWRRWSSPRFEGSPAARRWPSRKLLRQRAMINAALAYRSRPKRKHFDKAYSHLQFYRGSAATVGYDRFRRSHRTKSKNNRWWKPITVPVPFMSPYSRRSINARKHITRRLARQQSAYPGEIGTRLRGIKGAWFPIAQPPRIISSRNLEIKRRRFERPKAFKAREKAERAKLPATLQRWTVRAERYQLGSASSPRRTVVLTRTRRAIRKLEELCPRVNVWASNSWQNLDPAKSSTSPTALYSAACLSLPANFWNSLYQNYSTRAAALEARKVVFTKFSAWYRQVAATSVTSDNSSLLPEAVRCITTAVDALNAVHQQIEASQYTWVVTQKKDRFWRLRELPRLRKGVNELTSILQKTNSALYRRWLRGAERYLKRGRTSYLPPKYGRGGTSLIVNFGRNRRRFPAAGRRRHSYDSMLHAFAKRTAPSRFRQISSRGFKRVSGLIGTHFKINLRTYELPRALRRQRNLAQKLNRVTYLSNSWRELLAYRKGSPSSLPAAQSFQADSNPLGYAQPFGSGVKRRFAALPVSLLFKRVIASRGYLRSKTSLTLRTQRTGLLRAALRRRRQERAFVDLKKHLSRRKLPREELSAPWRRKRSARRREQHLRYGDWSPRHFQFQQSNALFWTLHDLEERAPRRRDRTRTILSRSYQNEVLAFPPSAVKKLSWAKKGFQIKLPNSKAHRRVRKEKKRRRRGRSGITKERRARFHHTSERRNVTQLKKISGRASTNLLKKIKGFGKKLSAVKLSNFKSCGFVVKASVQRRWRQPAKRAVLASAKRLFSFNRKELVREQLPSVVSLQLLSSEGHAKNMLQLGLRVDGGRSKFARRTYAAFRRSRNRQDVAASVTDSARPEYTKALRGYTAAVINTNQVAPLTFQKPTKLVVKSDAEKKRAIVWNIQSKELRYKRTAQYAESLTAYVPKLISHMLSQRIKNNSLSFAKVKTLINATYWNLRVYLNVDPFERRLALRDNSLNVLQGLAQDLAVLAKGQITEHADRSYLRKRFQSCRIHPAPTSDRFRLDWLRAFFPRKHALFQEDPEEYAAIPVSTRNIRRLIPSGYGIGRWRTAPAAISLERRSRQLLRLKLSKCAPRFETLLQTSRRTPLTEMDSVVPEINDETFAVNLSTQKQLNKKRSFATTPSGLLFKATAASSPLNTRAPVQLGLSVPKSSFFCRQFTTRSTRTAGAISQYISRRARLLTPESGRTSAFVAVASRYQLKGRAVARGRSSFTAHARWAIDTGSLDPRFLRFKSPRNRQYLVRLPAEITGRSDQEKLTNLLTLCEIRDNRDSAASKKRIADSRRFRTTRRYFYNDRDPDSYKTSLMNLRAAAITRRHPAFLRVRSAVVSQRLVEAEKYNFPNRGQLAFLTGTHSHGSLYTTPVQSATHRVVASARLILQYRTAKKRIASHVYVADRALRKLPFTLRPEPRRAGRLGKKANSVLARLENKRNSYLRLLRFATTGKKEHYLRLFTRAQRALRRAQNRLTASRTLQLYAPEAVGRLSKAAVLLGGDSVQPSLEVFTSKDRSLLGSPAFAANSFYCDTFRYLATQRRFTRSCMRLQAVRRRMIFDTSRPRLWHKLTGRWMKKERLMRNWLKEVKRWFRDPWLSQSVDITRPDNRRLLPGEIRAREQQAGEIVEGDENAGLTEEESLALQKAALPAIAAAQKVVKADNRRAYQLSRRAGALQKKVIRVRRAASQEALRTPRPSMWLADLQAKQKTAETAIWRTKTRKEKDDIRLAAKEAAIARAKAGLPPLAKKKDPLKMPADHWMPSIVWKDIQRRARRLEWRESDDAFARKGFRNAFRFYPSERNRVPWLESLMYNRSLFSTRLREFRRHQFPKEQKKYKWLQRVRKSLFPGKTHTYIKGRRWPRLRMYNQRLHYTLFNLPDRGAARRHFKKLNRRSRKVGFVHSQEGLSNRLDNVLIHLNIAPTIFWARVLAPHGLLRVNGAVMTQADYLFKSGDFIEPLWSRILRFRHFFEPPLARNEEVKRHKRFSIGGISKNFHFHRGIRCFTFLGNPRESDLRGSSRLQPHLFRWFRLDSV